jgi:hypothetical protein
MANKRWYDGNNQNEENDKIYMLVCHIRTVSQGKQKILASEINKKFEKYCGTAVKKRIKNDLLKSLCLFNKRDNDHNKYVIMALERLKNSPFHVREKITNEILANIIAGNYWSE